MHAASGPVARLPARVCMGMGAARKPELARHRLRGSRVSRPHGVSAGRRRGCAPTHAAVAGAARDCTHGGGPGGKRRPRCRGGCVAHSRRHRRRRGHTRRARAPGRFRRGSLRARLLPRAARRFAPPPASTTARCRLPPSTSWCEADGWMDGLPVAEAVPMLFRMGTDRYSPGSDFRDDLCRSSVGIATDELPSRVPPGRRVYVFSPRAWSPDQLQAVLREVSRWRSAF